MWLWLLLLLCLGSSFAVCLTLSRYVFVVFVLLCFNWDVCFELSLGCCTALCHCCFGAAASCCGEGDGLFMPWDTTASSSCPSHAVMTLPSFLLCCWCTLWLLTVQQLSLASYVTLLRHLLTVLKLCCYRRDLFMSSLCHDLVFLLVVFVAASCWCCAERDDR